MNDSFSLSRWVTSRDGRVPLEVLPVVKLDALDAACGAAVTIWMDDAVSYQEIEGFGGAFTESAAVTWLKLPKEKQDEVLRAYFDAEAGCGYTMCRTHFNSCDFSEGNYAYCEKEGDVKLESFSIERDRKALIPMIKRAQEVAGGKMRLFASPWSPPAWMKTTGQMNRGGKLKAEYRQVWADYFVRYIREYAKEGIEIMGVTVQNEPDAVQTWDSCTYNAAEERDFVRDYLGPTLEREGLGHVRIIVWDHNRERMYDRAKVILGDPAAARYVWGTGFHWYTADVFENVQRVHDAWPDKKLIFTEGCQEGGPHTGSWALGERYARSIIQDLNHWTVSWVDWNLVLDERGGPNHVGNLCSAPILADTQAGVPLYQNSYYYIRHFSQFMRPGAKRILSTSSKDALEVLACKNADGSITGVILNRSENVMHPTVKFNQGQAVVEVGRRSITTVRVEGI